ncbi:MAG: 3-deoxy-manno-octulosonate cytidylyltransferase [Candidatus Marinimicrobia bacterium]|nr:3-deoxy-manno-octulosonate cytidylyltransferase [Candidatus Neomarinimicrobiota bacterium]
MNIGVIPARYHSERFPQKILTPIHDKPMVAHVAERALRSKLLDKVIIAIDHEQTRTALESYEFEVIMTSPDHKSGTDRIGEVLSKVDADIIVNIQGDEPLMDSDIIDGIINLFHNSDIQMATAVSTAITPDDYFNENIVKAFLDEHSRAISFQRQINQNEIGGCYKHLGIYAYTKTALTQFIQLPQSEHEKALRLEQWRALDNGIDIYTVITNYPHHGVDVPSDLDYILKHLKK